MAWSRAVKTERQRQKRAAAAIAAGRIPHRTGRPPGRTKPPPPAPVVIPVLHTGHELFEAARRATGIERDERSRTLRRRDDVMREDGLSEAVLALLEGRDPAAAWRSFRNRELAWVYRTCWLPDDDDQ